MAKIETNFHSDRAAMISAHCASGYPFIVARSPDGSTVAIHMTVEQARKVLSDLDGGLAIHDATEAAKALVKAKREAA